MEALRAVCAKTDCIMLLEGCGTLREELGGDCCLERRPTSATVGCCCRDWRAHRGCEAANGPSRRVRRIVSYCAIKGALLGRRQAACAAGDPCNGPEWGKWGGLISESNPRSAAS